MKLVPKALEGVRSRYIQLLNGLFNSYKNRQFSLYVVFLLTSLNCNYVHKISKIKYFRSMSELVIGVTYM